MKFEPREPPRTFTVGREPIVLKDCGAITLEPDEQVTFVTGGGAEYDVARKDWGFYATPSLNGRLPDHGLRPALVVSASNRLYLLLVEDPDDGRFEQYLAAEDMRVLAWLDSDDRVDDLVRRLGD